MMTTTSHSMCIELQAARRRRREEGEDVLRATTSKLLSNHLRMQLLGEKTTPAKTQKQKDMFELPETADLDLAADDESDNDDDGKTRTEYTFFDTRNIDVFSPDFDALPLEIQVSNLGLALLA